MRILSLSVALTLLTLLQFSSVAQSSILLPNTPQFEGRFGGYVCSNDDFLAVSSPRYDHDEGLGIIDLYKWIDDELSWHSQLKNPTVSESTSNVGLGFQMTMHSNILCAVDRADNAIITYRYSPESDTWIKINTVEISSPRDFFHSNFVTMNADFLAIGIPNFENDNESKGIVQLFELDGDEWSLVHTLSSPDEDATNAFGYDVQLNSNNDLLVGSGQDDNQDIEGKAFIYRYDADDEWSLRETIEGSGALDPGLALTLNDDYMIVNNGDQDGWFLEIYDISAEPLVLIDQIENRTIIGVSGFFLFAGEIVEMYEDDKFLVCPLFGGAIRQYSIVNDTVQLLQSYPANATDEEDFLLDQIDHGVSFTTWKNKVIVGAQKHSEQGSLLTGALYIYDPVVLSIDEQPHSVVTQNIFSPNPTNGNVSIDKSIECDNPSIVSVIDVSTGVSVRIEKYQDISSLPHYLASGTYLINFDCSGSTKSYTGRLIKI